MYDNYNYPIGTDNSMAPWNQADIPEQEFDVTVSQTLSKDTTVTTDDYIPGTTEVECEPDGEGGYFTSGGQEPDDTSNTDWREAYKNEHYSPLELIQILKDILKEQAESWVGFENMPWSKREMHRIEHLIEECSGWVEDETEVIGN